MARLHAHGEDGFAIPAVTLMLLGMMAILGAGAVAAMNTQSGTVRDTDTKAALAVAESGVDNALLRYARAEVTETEPCVDEAGTPTTVDSTEWCEPVSGQVDGSDYTYHVRPEVTGTGEDLDYDLEIVSVGTVDGVSRVVEIDGDPTFAVDPEPVYLTESLVADEHMHLAPSADVTGDIGSNGTIEVNNSTEICGDIRYGSTYSSSEDDMENSQCDDPSYEVVEKTFELERMELPEGEDWDANNSNLDDSQGGVTWDSEARELTVEGGVELTVDHPGPYLLCRLDVLGQSTIDIAPEVEANFYFDDPSNCDLDKEPMDGVDTAEIETVDDDGYLQMNFDRGNLTIDEGEPYPVLYFLGSETDETFIDINTNSGADGEFKGVLYAPDTHIVNSRSGFRFTGAMVGRSVWIDPGGDVDDTDVEIIGDEFEIGVNEAIYTVFMKEGFRECPVSAADTDTPYEQC